MKRFVILFMQVTLISTQNGCRRRSSRPFLVKGRGAETKISFFCSFFLHFYFVRMCFFIYIKISILNIFEHLI